LGLSFFYQVLERISLARTAQQQWAKSSFPQRRHLLRIILRFVVENAEAMAKWLAGTAARR